MKRKSVSLVLSLAILFSMVYITGLTTTVSATGFGAGAPLSEALKGYKRITIADINASSGYRIMDQDGDEDDDLLTVNGSWPLSYAGSFGGKNYLDVDMNFNNSGSGAFALSWQGNERYRNAFYLYMYGKTNFVLGHYDADQQLSTLCQATPASFGVSPTDYFNVKLLTNVEKDSTSAATETVTWQCWVNDMYVDGGTFTETAHTRKVFTTGSGGSLKMRVPKVLEEEFEGYQKVSISDFHAGDGSTIAISATPAGLAIDNSNKITFRSYNQPVITANTSPEDAATYSLDKKYFDFDINQNGSTSDASAIFLYEREHWYDDLMIYWTDANNLKFDYRKKVGSSVQTSTTTYDLRAFGRATNTEFFNLKIRSDFSANASDNTRRDAVIQIWINDRFADEIVLEATDMRNGLVMRRAGSVNWLLRESKDIVEELEGYRRVDMFDFNKTVGTDGVVNLGISDTATSYLTDFDKTYLDVDLNYGGETARGGAAFQYLAYAKWTNSLYLGFNGTTKFILSKYTHARALTDLATLTANDFGISPSEYFNVKLRTDIETVSSSEYRVTAQLWLNNMFACEVTTNFTYGPDIEGNNYTAEQTGIGTTIRTVSKAVSVKSAVDPDTQLEGHKRIVGDDFDTIGASVAYSGTPYASALAGEYTGDISNLARSYIEADIMTPNGMNPFMVWPSKNKTTTGFYGDGEQIRFYLDGTTLKLQKVHGGSAAGTETLGDISEAPYNYSASDFFNIKVKTDIYGANSISLAIWVNDSFLKRVYVTTYDAETIADMTCLGFRGTNTTDKCTYVRTPFDNAKLLNLEYNLAYGDFLLKGWPTFRVNGTTMSAGEVLGAPGDYTVEYMLDGEPTASRTISLYKLGDTNLDGDAFVEGDSVYRDAYTTVGMIKYGAVTRASVLAADLNNDGVLDDADSALFMAVKGDVTKVDSIVGVNFGDSIGFNYEGGKNVMPIGGYYGPAATAEITDAMYRTIKNSGINMINFLPTKWGTGDDRDVLRSLALAQKYGIGVYITDQTTNALTVDEENNVTGQTTVSTASELANAMAQYGIYDSVIGIEVIDEPKPSTGGNWNADYYKRYKYYDELLGTLKSYSNVSGGYVLQGAGAYEPGEYGLVSEVEPDVDYLAFDSYLYLEKGATIKRYKLNAYFESLDAMRQQSADNNKPFWSYVSAGSDFRDDGSDGATGYYSTEADILWNVNTSLAFGAKGIIYFPMIQPLYFSNDATSNTGHDYDRNGIIGADGNTNRYYTMVQRANTQISAVDDVLMNADSKGVIAVGKAATDINSAASQRNYTFKGILSRTGGKYTDKLTNVTTSKDAGAMVGAFGYHSSEAYYVVNYDTTENATQTITLTFGGTQNVTVIKDGVDTTYNSVGSLDLTLDSGEGVLVILEDYHDIVINAATASYTLTEAATVNGVARAASYEIKDCGVYAVQYVSGTTYNVVIYKIGDITADSTIDVRDLVKLKKYVAGIDTINKSGQNALHGLNVPVPGDQLITMVNMLLGR